MTNDFAIKVLTELRGYGDKFANIGFDRKEALDMAIEALEQEPCEDAVSRQAVIDAIDNIDWYHISNKGELVQGANKQTMPLYKAADIFYAIDALPSVTPQQQSVTDFADKCKECGKILNDKLQTSWIPVSERLPEDLEAVNIIWVNHEPEPYYHEIKDKNFVATGIHFRGKWYWYSTTCADYLGEYGKNEFDMVDDAIEIIAWMPLPEPYNAESEK